MDEEAFVMVTTTTCNFMNMAPAAHSLLFILLYGLSLGIVVLLCLKQRRESNYYEEKHLKNTGNG